MWAHHEVVMQNDKNMTANVNYVKCMTISCIFEAGIRGRQLKKVDYLVNFYGIEQGVVNSKEGCPAQNIFQQILPHR